MKIYEYDPKTGKKGSFLYDLRVGYVTSLLSDMIRDGIVEPLEELKTYKQPFFGENTSTMVCQGAGKVLIGKDVPIDEDVWVCFEWSTCFRTKMVTWAIVPPLKRVQIVNPPEWKQHLNNFLKHNNLHVSIDEYDLLSQAFKYMTK